MLSQVGADSVVAGRYTLERCINAGGIGALWRARDEQTGRTCAMRLADGTGHNIFELAARYRAEVDIIDRIRCENVVDILDYGDWNEMPYLVVEHVEGEDLATRLRREVHLTPELAYRLLAQTARALARAHAVGIVHGDVTPEHILIAAEGMQSVAKVFNFGLSQRTSEISVATVTRIGSFLRLPYYASPEQVAGKSLDWRSDLWSLGVLGYECLTGKKPFESNVFGDLVAMILCEPVQAIDLPGRSTPAALQNWWEKACARDPEQRFQSAKAMSDALGKAFDFPIVFVPDSAAGDAGSATSCTPAPLVVTSVTEESRVGLRTKSQPKLIRHTTQIGLGAVSAKLPIPVPTAVAPVPTAPIELPSPVASVQSPPIELPSPVSGSVDLEEDLFEGFRLSEAPTVATRQAEVVVPEEEQVDSLYFASQSKRTRSLRKTVTWAVAVLVALITLPLIRSIVAAKHVKSGSAHPAQARGNSPSATSETALGAQEAAPIPAASAIATVESEVKLEAPSLAESLKSHLGLGKERTTGDDVRTNQQKVAVTHAQAASESRPKAARAISSSQGAAATSVGDRHVHEQAPAVAPTPAKPKALPTSRDYGI